jgi:hypothetical protein
MLSTNHLREDTLTRQKLIKIKRFSLVCWTLHFKFNFVANDP